MSPETAALIRQTIWPKWLLGQYNNLPASYHTCSCQGGATGWCMNGNHDGCSSGDGEALAHCETYILTRAGYVASMPAEFEHPSLAATGLRRVRYAMVWLADRKCRWKCPCDCHVLAVERWVQADLFAELVTA